MSLRLAPELGAAQLDLALAVGRRGRGLARRTEPLPSVAGSPPALVIDLTGSAPATGTPTLRLRLQGAYSVPLGIAAMLADGLLPELLVELDGTAVARAAPMLEDRVWLGRMTDTVLSSAITLIASTVRAFFDHRLQPLDVLPPVGMNRGLVRAYLPLLARGLGGRVWSRIARRPEAPWKVAYRLLDDPAATPIGQLDGPAFTLLEDDGRRFYADPFILEHEGRPVLFVEEFPYVTRKGVISVSELGPNGRFETPRVVLETSHHLSYPQVFRHDGIIYMIPESSGANELVLYRAERFPDIWQRDAVLLEATNVNDATLLVRDGRFWLVGTQRLGSGSSSDTMVVYGAPALHGPWTPHRLNPIRIDRSAARPGGAFVDLGGGRTTLPVQDGSRTYGGSLGLMDLLRIDDDEVVWGPVRPILPGSAWPGHSIHSLNRLGRLEVVDSVD